MTDAQMNEMIKRVAASYNAPPATVPREEMWSAVKAARGSGPQVIYGSAPTNSSHSMRFSRSIWIGAAAAATLLVVASVEVGRWSVASAPGSRTATSGQGAPAHVVSTVAANSPDLPAQSGTNAATIKQLPSRSETRIASPLRVAQQDVRAARPGTRSPDQTAYRLVTLTHLSDAEAMLTSFRSHTDEKTDAAMAKWARDLLTNTRLLLDSPAAADPRRRQLLEDLELTLVDIVQLSPEAGAQDRQMIEKNLDRGHVLTRLRTAIPAGMQKGS